MKENIVDKIYLSLELTKIYVDHSVNKDRFSREAVADIFNYYVTTLTGIEHFDELTRVREQLEEYKQEYDRLAKSINEHVEARIGYKISAIEKVLKDSKGDMEPYVYDNLILALKD